MLAPLKWRITYGDPRRGTGFVLIVEAANAGEAREKGKRIARERGHTARCGVVRLDVKSMQKVLETALWEAAECP